MHYLHFISFLQPTTGRTFVEITRHLIKRGKIDINKDIQVGKIGRKRGKNCKPRCLTKHERPEGTFKHLDNLEGFRLIKVL